MTNAELMKSIKAMKIMGLCGVEEKTMGDTKVTLCEIDKLNLKMKKKKKHFMPQLQRKPKASQCLSY